MGDFQTTITLDELRRRNEEAQRAAEQQRQQAQPKQ